MTPELPPPLEHRLNMVVGNLERARKYGAGLILFVIYQAETVRAEFERLLLARLAQSSQRVRRIHFQRHAMPEAGDLLGLLQQHPPAPDEVIFVYDVLYAFPGLLNALNYRRELIPEGRWRLLFWLLEEEAVQIMRAAPDFWAFVNQTIELPELPSPVEQAQLAQAVTRGDRAWANRFSQLSAAERQARIALRERLLAELPPDETTLLSRADLHAGLGDLYQFEDQLQTARTHYEAALTLFSQIDAKLGQANTLIGWGDLQDRLDQPEEALKHYQAGLAIFEQIGDRYSIARTILLFMGPFFIRRGQAEAAFQVYAWGLQVTLEMDFQFFWAFLGGVVQEAQKLARAQPDQAAAGCGTLLGELEKAPAGTEQTGELLALTADIFRVIGLAALAAGQSGPEQAETLAQAQTLAQRVDEATNSALGLAAWLDEREA